MIHRTQKKEKPWFWESGKQPHRRRPALPSDYRMEMLGGRGGEKIQLSGMDRILKCEKTELLLRAGAVRLSLLGSELCITAFRYGTVEIIGHISELRLMGEKE